MITFHRHRYSEPVAEQMVKKTYHLDGTNLGIDAPITVVTDRCRVCGKLRQQTVEGSLSAESLGFLLDN
ncbi:hypothetical protein LCGC14_3042770 [marine sediment metagenome]|uniref:Uncharacterized protein n=1 Tax=marine sediment metagenome TaxID=412755 RepID=A0A0F8WNY6_9ZZZZ